MSDVSDLPYRPCVGVTLFNKDGLVWVGERLDNPGAWQMPQGGIDPGEDIVEAGRRELKEETGATNVEILKVGKDKVYYDLPPDLQQKLWGGQFRGQEQTWIAARFLGEDSEVNLTAFDPPEFSAWKWVSLQETVDLIVPFKRDTYRQVIAMFEEFSA